MAGQFKDLDAALKMRDIIKSFVRIEIDNQRPKKKYGQVAAINRTALTADVLFIGETNPVTVKMNPLVQPLSSNAVVVSPDTVGAVVKVEGSTNDYWITEVIQGAVFANIGLQAWNELASSPSTPPSGQAYLYIKSDGYAYYLNDSGVEFKMSTNPVGTPAAVALAAGAYALQIGANGVANLIFDSANVQARNNGAAADMTLNQYGNDVLVGGSKAGSTLQLTGGGGFGSVQSWSGGVAGGTLYLNNNGGGLYNAAMLPVDGGGTNVAMSTTSSTFNAPTNTPGFTIPYPASGSLIICMNGGMQLSTVAAASFNVVSFEIRDTNSSGTIRWAASDNKSMSTDGTSDGATTGTVPGAGIFVAATGLPTSGTAFVRLMIRSSDNASTATLQRPHLAVIPGL